MRKVTFRRLGALPGIEWHMYSKNNYFSASFGVRTLVVAALAVVLGGCQAYSRLIRDPNLPQAAERLKTAVDAGSDAELELPIESTAEANFLLRPVTQSDPLPNIPLRNVNVTESGLYDAMQLIAASAGLSLSNHRLPIERKAEA